MIKIFKKELEKLTNEQLKELANNLLVDILEIGYTEEDILEEIESYKDLF